MARFEVSFGLVLDVAKLAVTWGEVVCVLAQSPSRRGGHFDRRAVPERHRFWVPSEADKEALVQDPSSPFFTTPHFNGYLSVLVRASRLGEITREELAEVIQDAWLSQASPKRASAWLVSHGLAAPAGSEPVRPRS